MMQSTLPTIVAAPVVAFRRAAVRIAHSRLGVRQENATTSGANAETSRSSRSVRTWSSKNTST